MSNNGTDGQDNDGPNASKHSNEDANHTDCTTISTPICGQRQHTSSNANVDKDEAKQPDHSDINLRVCNTCHHIWKLSVPLVDHKLGPVNY